METINQVTITDTERLRSFDILANVYALRRDIDVYGYVLDETREQVGNEQLSYITEGIDRAARTSFDLKCMGSELVYFDDGDWRLYADMIETGLLAAQYDAGLDKRCEFLIEWAERDKYHFDNMNQLLPGQRHVWASPYPQDVEDRFGPKFLESKGLNPTRRLGFIYQASCLEDGTIRLESQTVDRSDEAALSKVLQSFEQDQSLGLDDLVEVYDQHLSQTYGGRYYAGRSDAERAENAWQLIRANRDLVELLLNGLESIARSPAGRFELEETTRKHIYGVWALMKKRLDGTAAAMTMDSENANHGFVTWRLSQEVRSALVEFASEGKVLAGCGGSISLDDQIEDMDAAGAHESIFTSRNRKTEVMKCVTCPLCNRQGVDATIVYKDNKKIITCSKCNKSKTYKV